MRNARIASYVMAVLLIPGLAFFLYPITGQAVTDDVQVDLLVEGCNNNGICQANIGEDALTCPADCASTPPVVSTSTPPTVDYAPNRSSGYRVRQEAARRILITDVQISPSRSSATLTWQTSEPAISTLAWGLTQDYEKGALGEFYITGSHSMQITGLLPDTRYYFFILVTDRFGRYGSLVSEFQTNPAYIPPPPILVREDPFSDRFTLSWSNPQGSEYVRVMRYDPSLPIDDPYTGDMVYEGSGEAFGGQRQSESQQYSVFSRHDGEYELVGTAQVATSTGVSFNGQDATEDEPEEESFMAGLGTLAERFWWVLLLVILLLRLFRRVIFKR